MHVNAVALAEEVLATRANSARAAIDTPISSARLILDLCSSRRSDGWYDRDTPLFNVVRAIAMMVYRTRHRKIAIVERRASCVVEVLCVSDLVPVRAFVGRIRTKNNGTLYDTMRLIIYSYYMF
jgi:hypothetical protein